MTPTFVEFYAKSEGRVTTVQSMMVPPVGSFISIRQKTYRVTSVTFAVDYSANPSPEYRVMRACVDMESAK